MYNNIEISEINHLAVRKSLIVTFIVFFVGAFIFGCLYRHTGLGLYLLIGMLFYGAFVWIPTVIVISYIERLFLRKRANETKVILLFTIELLFPLSVVLLFADQRELKPGMYLVMILIGGQLLRWLYLRFTKQMFNYIP